MTLIQRFPSWLPQGYRAKQGFVIYRVRVRRGSRKKPVAKGCTYGKPTHHGINQMKFQRSLQSIAGKWSGAGFVWKFPFPTGKSARKSRFYRHSCVTSVEEQDPRDTGSQLFRVILFGNADLRGVCALWELVRLIFNENSKMAFFFLDLICFFFVQ